jgi:N-acetylneuraminic acid mutarotase
MTGEIQNDLSWRTRAPLPQPRAGYMAAVVDGRYVLAGGSYWNANEKVWTSRVDEFEPASNTWSEAAPLPEPRSDAACVALQNDLYIFGGGDHLHARQDALVLRNKKWVELPDLALPEPRLYASAVASGDSIYVLGGMSKAGDYASAQNTLWICNVNKPRGPWETPPGFPGPGLISMAAAVVSDKIYIFGGAYAAENGVANSNSVLEFDCTLRRWRCLPDLPVSRRCWCAVPLPEAILLIGGFTSTYEKDVFRYDLRSHSLTPAGLLPHGMCDAKFFRLGGRVIGTGGEVADRIRGASTFESALPPHWIANPPPTRP